MITLSVALGSLGMIAILSKRTFIGVLIGTQLLLLGGSLAFILAGVSSGAASKGQVFGFFILVSGVGQLVVGFAMAVRLFYLKKDIRMDKLKTLRH